MIKKIWYYSLRTQVLLGFLLFFSKFEVRGKKNVSRNRPTIFLPNHENTFLDALTLSSSSWRRTHFMARADIFKKPRLAWWLYSVNLRPIYRMRDGKNAVAKNQKVFDDLQNFLNKGQCVMIHPEGSHSLDYRIRSFHSGFARLAAGFLEKYPDKELDIIPVGINYSNHTAFRSRVSIEYGKPTEARKYFAGKDKNEAIQQLRGKMEDETKALVTHIEPLKEYDKRFNDLKAAGADFSDPADTREKLLQLEKGQTPSPSKLKKPTAFEKILYPVVYLNNIILVLLWKKMKPLFKDPAWHGSIKFVLGTFLGPLIYLLQTLVVYLLFGPVWAFLYLFFSLITVSILRIGQGHEAY